MNKRLSEFAHLVRVNDEEQALFNSLWLRVIFVENKFVPFLKDMMAGHGLKETLGKFANLEDLPRLVSLMTEEMFFEPEADKKRLSELREAISKLPIGVMYLMTSMDCNLACTYCYLADSLNLERKNGKMSQETAKRAIDVFARLVNDRQLLHPKIILHGGEPILNWPVVMFAVEYASGKLPTCQFTINTNGTQIDAEKARFFADKHVNVAISIDGPSDIHDSVRVDRRGGPTFERALNGYRLVKEAGGNPGISCTITPANVDRLLEVIQWLHSELGVFSLGFNFMIGVRTEENEKYIEKASKVLVECFKYAREHGIYEDRMMRRINALADGKVVFNDCAGCGQQLVVTPQNQVGVCQGFINTDTNFIPFTDSFDPEHPLWRRWRSRSPFNIPACLECEALGLCGGGCAYVSHINGKDIMTVDPNHCTHVKTALRFMLTDLHQHCQ